jgi:membrane protein DedA with SNARE-associated domain
VLAAHHRLDIWMVIAAAAVGATTGGIAGWLVGMRASRPVLIGRGPFLRTRQFLIARGERFFERHGPLGVFLAPSWAAGVHNMPARRFIPLNTLAAIGWAAVYGIAAFLLGPSVADAVGDFGALLPIAVAVLIVASLILRRLRPKLLRRRKTRLREG